MLGVTNGKHTDTDMSSLQEITKYNDEKGNPVAMFSDIGLLYGKVANEQNAVPPYLPPSAEKLPAGYKGTRAAGSPPSLACRRSMSTSTPSVTPKCRRPGMICFVRT
jgi:hypothetical protein